MPRSSWLGAIVAHLILVAACAVALYPVLWVLKMALQPAQVFDLSLSPIPREVTLDNFRAVAGRMADDGTWLFGRQLFNSLVVAGVTTLVGLALAIPAAYAASRAPFPGRDAGLGFLIVTQMFPGVAMAIPLYILLERLGLLNALSGLVLVYSTSALPFCVWSLKAYFDTIPRDLDEAATIDGASRFTILRRVILPLAAPGVAVTGLFCFMAAWNEFVLAATLIGDERAYTLPVTLRSYVGEYSAQWGLFAAGAVIVSTPVAAIFIGLQRFLASGLTAGAVKG